MSSIQDIVSAVGGTSPDDESPASRYMKRIHSTGEGDRFEERILALVFLRCLSRGLPFQLSANNAGGGKFDDVVLVWRPKGRPEAHTLLVQVKHKTFRKKIHVDTFMSGRSGFGLGMYSTSHREISQSLNTKRVTCVLLTNAGPDDKSLEIFEQQEVGNVPGIELLHAGGDLYKLKKDNQLVCEEVRENSSFVENFYLLCWQSNYVDIMVHIYRELEGLLATGDLCGPIGDSLCKSIREWMNEESVCLTSGWSKWQALVDEYIRGHVTACRAVTTRLRYHSVADVRGYLESCNPAWVRPPERETEALSATKVHQALADDKHIMVPVELFSEQQHRFSQQRRRVLRCWGPLCRWLVVVDDDREGNSVSLTELVTRIGTERRLVIVSSRENNGFIDTCQSSEINDDTWKKCLDIRVRLDGDRNEGCLRDLVAGVDAVKSLKSLLLDEPRLLLALALRMGREPEPLPEQDSPKELVDPPPVTLSVLSSLGFRDVCITDSVYYESLKHKIGTHSLTSFAEVGSWIFTPSKFEWPLFVLTDNLNTIQENIRRLPIFKFHIISYRTGENARELPGGLDTASNVAIVEGRPRVHN